MTTQTLRPATTNTAATTNSNKTAVLISAFRVVVCFMFVCHGLQGFGFFGGIDGAGAGVPVGRSTRLAFQDYGFLALSGCHSSDDPETVTLSPTPRSTVQRGKKRAVTERSALHDILDAGLICHLGVVVRGSPLVLPTGVNVTLSGGRYVITDEDGNSVIAIPRFASPNYLDVKVGVGTSPTTVRGLLGNPKNDVNYLEARDGTVFAVPLSFQDLYQKFGDSWRVRPMESMLNVCGSPSDVGNPAKPFSANDLPQETRQRAQVVCERNKVIKPWLNSCVLDVGVLGEKAAAVYVGLQPPVRDGNAQ
ncbi:hypothetical protein ACFQ1S_11865 [Kibdelosporangium lantanae]|uniref:VWFD domain-containing protein n=1 Tax=Kibdelosporangium lantanae TaxID=1497396 RepID=A0ABW3MB85_9PSEU